jgi:hypothetical protein
MVLMVVLLHEEVEDLAKLFALRANTTEFGIFVSKYAVIHL